MPITLPIDNTFSNFSFNVPLDGTTYIFNFVYNTRSEQWTMHISDIDGNALVNGIKLVLSYDLFDQYKHLNIPPGELYAIDTTKKEIEITRENLGEAVKLVYILESELDTI